MDKSLLQKKIISVSATFGVALSTVSGKKRGFQGKSSDMGKKKNISSGRAEGNFVKTEPIP